jgi:hypothetical protein
MQNTNIGKRVQLKLGRKKFASSWSRGPPGVERVCKWICANFFLTNAVKMVGQLYKN